MKTKIVVSEQNYGKLIEGYLTVNGLKESYILDMLIEDYCFDHTIVEQFILKDSDIFNKFCQKFGIDFDYSDDTGLIAEYNRDTKTWYIMLEVYPEDDFKYQEGIVKRLIKDLRKISN